MPDLAFWRVRLLSLATPWGVTLLPAMSRWPFRELVQLSYAGIVEGCGAQGAGLRAWMLDRFSFKPASFTEDTFISK